MGASQPASQDPARSLSSQDSVSQPARRSGPARTMPNYPEPKFRGPKRTRAPRPLSRAELHIHLDGSLRLSTVWELSRAKPDFLFPEALTSRDQGNKTVAL